MPSYRVAGVDKETGFHTRVIVEASNPDEALVIAGKKQVVNPRVEETIGAEPSAALSPLKSRAQSAGMAYTAGRTMSRVWRNTRVEFQVAALVTLSLCVGMILWLFGPDSGADQNVQPSVVHRNPPRQREVRANRISVDDVSFKIIRVPGDLWQISWKASVHNRIDRSVTVGSVMIQFLDQQGFEVTKDYLFDVVLAPGMNEITSTCGLSYDRPSHIVEAKCSVRE